MPPPTWLQAIADQARIPAPTLSHLQAHATPFAIPFPQKFFSFPWGARVPSELPGGDGGSEDGGGGKEGGVDNDQAQEKIMVLNQVPLLLLIWH